MSDPTAPVTLADLRDLWERRDPMPVDLPDAIIAAIAAESLDVELLTLTAPATAAVRGEAQVLECTLGDVTIAVRISDSSDGTRRIDGWSSGITAVELLLESGARSAAVTQAGRFEFSDVPSGPVRLRLHSDHKNFETNEFEI